jgi:chromosomal replication initiation ATPase DnaA
MTVQNDDAQTVIAIFHAVRAHNLTALLHEVCQQRGVQLYEICGRARTLGVTLARHELWWRIRHHPERHYSYVEIARLFQRAHTTILQGVRAHQNRNQP